MFAWVMMMVMTSPKAQDYHDHGYHPPSYVLPGPPEFGDFGYLHRDFHPWYSTAERGGPLMRPHNPTVRCCHDDGRPTKAKFTAGNWYAYVDRMWVLVPPNRIKLGFTPPDKPFRSAHVFASRFNGKDPVEIYCFIPAEADG